ncbi:19498_t:CDS:2, partial [Racocetra fulgida]
GCVESRMISLAECGRLKKRHRDSSENCCKSVEQIIDDRETNTGNSYDVKNVEIKEKKDARMPKKQRPHSEIGSSNFNNSSIDHEIQTTIIHDDNNNARTITLQHKHEHEIPDTDKNQERGTSSRNNPRIDGREVEVDDDDEFYQEFPPGYYHVVNITDCDPQTFSRIYKELAISNVAEVLFSLGHQWMDLKRVCMDYILKHFTAIRDTEGFNRVFDHPEKYSGFSEIARELFRRLKTSEEKEL